MTKASSRSSHTTQKTFVLVHGSWHGGWCYKRVADVLTERGHVVYRPSLTGLGDRSHLLNASIDLSTHVDDIVNLMEWEDLSDIVLCGHSYGGMVITGVAERVPDRISTLVYLDAALPQDGQSLATILQEGKLDGEPAAEALLDFADSASQTGMAVMPPIPASAYNLAAEDCELVDRLCTPHPVATFVQPLERANDLSGIRRKVFIEGSNWGPPGDKPTKLCYQALENKDQWEYIDMPYGHDLMLDAPRKVADILDGCGF